MDRKKQDKIFNIFMGCLLGVSIIGMILHMTDIFSVDVHRFTRFGLYAVIVMNPIYWIRRKRQERKENNSNNTN